MRMRGRFAIPRVELFRAAGVSPALGKDRCVGVSRTLAEGSPLRWAFRLPSPRSPEWDGRFARPSRRLGGARRGTCVFVPVSDLWRQVCCARVCPGPQCLGAGDVPAPRPSRVNAPRG